MPPAFFQRKVFMYKIKFLPTGHIFILPEIEAKKLKENSPSEYQILEKNGKKFKDKMNKSKPEDSKSILSKILED